MEEQTLYQYWKEVLREVSPSLRRKFLIALAVYVALWVLGFYLAPSHVGGIAKMDDVLGRILGTLMMGPTAVLWAILVETGFIADGVRNANGNWLAVALLHTSITAAIGWLSFQPVSLQARQKRAAARHRRSQGQLEESAIAEKLGVALGVPLATVKGKKKKRVTVGVDFDRGQGHVIVTAPTRAGKGLHLTEVLQRWAGPAVVVDPKWEQYARTAGYREKYIGPSYHLPGEVIDLASFYDLCDPDDIQELHAQLMRPDDDHQRIFADKSLALIRAVGYYARAHELNPLRVLLDAAEDDLKKVLTGLDSVAEARPFVRQFTNGQPPAEVTPSDRFLTSAYGTFTTRLFRYQKHINTICPGNTDRRIIGRLWEHERATIYINYHLNELEGVGGVVAAILAGLMRNHSFYAGKPRLLVAIDELAAVRLRNLETYLATVAGSGITLLLYTQSLSQLEGIYGRSGAEAILSNCAHQVWYPPNEIESAKHISDLYGTSLKPVRTFSTVNRTVRNENGQTSTVPQRNVTETMVESPSYSPTEIMAFPKERVFVFTGDEQQIRFIGQRLDSRSSYNELPKAPRPPEPPKSPRQYTKWLPEEDLIKTESQTDAPVEGPLTSEALADEGNANGDAPDAQQNANNPSRPAKPNDGSLR